MLTVREVCYVLKHAKTIAIGYGETSLCFNCLNKLQMDAYGDYLVEDITCIDSEEGYYEVDLAVQLVKGV